MKKLLVLIAVVITGFSLMAQPPKVPATKGNEFWR